VTGGAGWLQQLLASYGYLAVFALVGLESAGVPMPGETASPGRRLAGG